MIEHLSRQPPDTQRRLVLGAAVAIVVLGAAAVSWLHPLVVLAALVTLPLAPLVLRDIDLAFAAVLGVITLLPFAALPLGIGFNPTLFDMSAGALYLIWAVRLATRAQPHLVLPPLSAGVVLLGGLALAAFLAGLAHGTPSRNQVRVFGELVMALGLFFVIANLITDRRTLRRAYLALVGFGTLAALVALGLYVLPEALQVELLSTLRVLDYPSGPGVLRFINDDPTRLQRATGTSIDPNNLGGLLAVIAALILPQVVARRPLVRRSVAALLAGITVLALVASVSRGALLGLAAAVGVIGLLRDRRLLAAGVLALALLLAVAQILPWTSGYVDHFAAGLRGEDRATQMRFGEYRDALRLIGRYPVLGVGFGDVRDIDLYRGVSSLYLIIAETTGLLGLGAFVGLLGAVGGRLALAWRQLRTDDTLRPVVLGCLGALAAVAISGVFDHYFFTYPHAFALLWLVAGLGMRAVDLATDADEPQRASTATSR